MIPETETECEHRCRERLESCKTRYRQAKMDAAAAREAVRHGDIPAPDGAQAYCSALAAERLALQMYMKALREFMRFVIDGQPPEPEE